MLLLYGIGFVAGLIAGISPCILPVLPVVLVAGATAPTDETDAASTEDSGADPSSTGAVRTVARSAAASARARVRARTRSYRAYAVIAGLVVSFSIVVLVGSSLLSFLGLPQDFLRDAGLVILGVVAVGLIVPPIGHLIERPFARLGQHQPRGGSSGFILGLGLGVVFAPCAGPVLSAITSVSASHRVGLRAVVLTVDFALGAAVPLLIFALAGQRVAERVAAFRSHAPVARAIGGVVLLTMMLLIAFNVTDGLQRVVPGYTTILQNHVEGGAYAKKQLSALTNNQVSTDLADCQPALAVFEDCGPAPKFAGISNWLNTPGGKPLTMAGLRGKVVLIDFWTYSCINCQRSLPHVEAWYARYHADGLEIVGVHTPEFAFEHVVSNVTQAAQQLGVHYPIAIDNDYKTWNAFNNNSWPADYLIDAQGNIRHVEVGEGDYSLTESLIRKLLVSAHPTVKLPSPTEVPDKTPRTALTPESYLGYDRLENYAGVAVSPNRAAPYQFPATLPPDSLAFGGTWTLGPQKITAGSGAKLELQFEAQDVYLVLGGTGTLQVSVNGVHTKTVAVAGIPRLYTLVQAPAIESATVTFTATPGIDAYDFTFG